MVTASQAELVASAREAWPDIALADEVFVAYVAARRAPADEDADAAWARLCIRDLWLACAITRGDPRAIRALDAQLVHVGEAIAHLDGGTALVADVTAAVRARVLGSHGDGKIGDYRGRGDLRGWLRVVAVREGLQLLRARGRERPIEPDLATQLDDGATGLSPDEQRLYKEAFAAALATLSPRERNLLRQQVVYGATVDELGALYRVHRATAARWLAQTRETVLRRTRRRLAEALHLADDEVDSALGRLAAHLDFSLRYTLSRE